jgi:hypothetical protein
MFFWVPLGITVGNKVRAEIFLLVTLVLSYFQKNLGEPILLHVLLGTFFLETISQ